ncbi:aspartate kinase [Brevibacillus daliensis]|uniref:aspartate kinase n=1 Tax=Brevibacillus daliensis TaxID=2892995 RepID=UPI001E61CFB4|nr:aspartate kinase [Brevibacillus daliensis]
MGIVVQKYGGTSVGTADRIHKVAERIIRYKNEGHQMIVVVSAMGKSTDVLVDLAKELHTNPPAREMDMLLATGEQVTIALLSMALQNRGYEAVSMTGWQAGITTEPIHGRARIHQIDNDRIKQELEQGRIVIVAGFQGASNTGEITTLGRGGSDTTAVALAASLQAECCEIYTDVSGVFTADPRIAPCAQKLDRISYDEMLELATLGAGVLHPRSVETAKKYQVKLIVRSSFTDEEGTIVEEESNMETGKVVSGIAHDTSVASITVIGMPVKVGMLSNLFKTLAISGINVDIIIQSTYHDKANNISFTTSTEDLPRAIQTLHAYQEDLGFESVEYEDDLAKVSIVGAGMITNPGVAADMFSHLSEQNILIRMVSTSDIKVSCVIPRDQISLAVSTLHRSFGLDVQEAVVHG